MHFTVISKYGLIGGSTVKSGLVNSNLYRNYLSIMLESFEVTTTEKVLLSFLIKLAKLEGFP